MRVLARMQALAQRQRGSDVVSALIDNGGDDGGGAGNGDGMAETDEAVAAAVETVCASALIDNSGDDGGGAGNGCGRN